jgi:hypothetical protein
MSLEVTAYSGIGPGVHDVRVTGLETKASKMGGDYLRWEFSGDEPDIEGKTTSANSSVEMTPGNKTGRWFAALTGKPTVVGERREMSEVIGRPCTIVQELNAEGYPKLIALTARNATVPARTPASVDIAAENAVAFAQTQHAIQEGNELP